MMKKLIALVLMVVVSFLLVSSQPAYACTTCGCQVKAAEDHAVEQINKARTQADKIIHDARHQAVELRMEITETARNQAKYKKLLLQK